MKKLFPVTVTVFSLVWPGAAQKGEFWERKDYRQWLQQECKRLLDNSPWSRKYTLSQVHIEPLQKSEEDTQNRAREASPKIEYQVQIRSALPIRRALVRISQLARNYDQMAADQRQAFDREADQFLAKEFPDSVVLNVAYTSNVQLDDREVHRHWRRQTRETLKNFVYLIGHKGLKAPLLDFTPGSGEARNFQLVFPRQYEGQPIVAEGDKSLKLEFTHPNIRSQGEIRVLIEFRLDRMLVNGELML
jgi:hypothetical protein